MTQHSLSIVAFARSHAQLEITCEAHARALLERIDECEARVKAWAHFEREQALAAARALDRTATRGPLHGVAFGVKDIFDTFDMPTQFGSPIYRAHRPSTDAACVAMTRRAGGLIFGKTATTEFATFPPSVTTNPHAATRTPGGSSSGSAAAVAAGMVPVAFGTQTTGSIIRPAAFCGVVGYKPSFGLLPRIGVKAITESFDTVGVFARSVADAAFVVAALSARDGLRAAQCASAPRIGICLTAHWAAAQAETQALFERLPRVLERAGAEVSDVKLPPAFAALNDAQNTIWEYEMARCLADEHRRHAQQLHARLRAQLDAGWATPAATYDAALAAARCARAQFAEAIGDVDVLVTASAPGEAPPIETTGDPVFCRTWSLLHTPAINVAVARAAGTLPLGLQIIGRNGDDARALACAHWIEQQLQGAAL